MAWGVGGEARWIGKRKPWAGQITGRLKTAALQARTMACTVLSDGWLWLPGESDAKSTPEVGSALGQSYTSAAPFSRCIWRPLGRNSTLILTFLLTSRVFPQRSVDILRQLGDMITSGLVTIWPRSAKSVEVTAVRDNGQATGHSSLLKTYRWGQGYILGYK